MRKFFQKILRNPVSRLAIKYSSRPDKLLVHQALTNLYQNIKENPGKKGPVISFDEEDSFIIFSDQHKGAKDGSDDFALAEDNYIKALEFYNQANFKYINLGDCEELWENSVLSVKKSNAVSFEKELLFINRDAYIKVFGNHDLYWDNDPLAPAMLESIYGKKVKVQEGLLLQTSINTQPLTIFLTHGHQGDKQSDGNWLSKWFVSTIWAPLQIYLELNLNTPAYDNQLKTVHNEFMYDWVAMQKNTLLITGHTHQPVFVSLTYMERLLSRLFKARQEKNKTEIDTVNQLIKLHNIDEDNTIDFLKYHPTYFNTGCCCFDDGDITGIEITKGFIRLIKWEYKKKGISERIVLEEAKLSEIQKMW